MAELFGAGELSEFKLALLVKNPAKEKDKFREFYETTGDLVISQARCNVPG